MEFVPNGNRPDLSRLALPPSPHSARTKPSLPLDCPWDIQKIHRHINRSVSVGFFVEWVTLGKHKKTSLCGPSLIPSPVMHWKGLRIGTSDANDKRRSLLEPQSQARHSEQLPRPTISTSNLAPRRSESAPRSPSLIEPEPDQTADNDGSQLAACRSHNLPAPTPRVRSGLTPGDNSSWRRNRFSFMRLRHASDPQLSQSYAKGEEDVPPVPSLPRKKNHHLCLLRFQIFAWLIMLACNSSDHHHHGSHESRTRPTYQAHQDQV